MSDELAAQCDVEECEQSRWEGGGRLCASHRGRLAKALREVPEHALTITAMVGHTTTNGGDKVSGSKEQPLPAASVLALTGPQADGSHSGAPEDEAGPTVLSVIGEWALFVEDELELIHQTYPTSLAGLRLVCQTLTRRQSFDFLCSCDLAQSAYDEITTVWKQVRKAAGDDPQPQRGKVPCPIETCHMRALLSEEPGEPYRCLRSMGGCGSQITEAQHDALADALGSRFLTHDEQAHLDAQHESVAVATHWRPTERGEFTPKHIPKPQPGEPGTVRAYGTANDGEKMSA